MAIRQIVLTAICFFAGASWIATSTVLPELGYAFLAGGVGAILGLFWNLAG